MTTAPSRITSGTPARARALVAASYRRWALPYQQRFMADPAQIRVWRCTRQGGKSKTIALEKTIERIMGWRTLGLTYTAQTEDRAREFVADCAAWARKMNQVASVVAGVEIIDEKEFKVWNLTLTDPDGRESIIRGLSSAPGAIRGTTGDWVWDEAGFHPDDREMWSAGAPITLWGGRIDVISSAPKRLGTWFDDLTAMGLRRRDPGTHGDPKPGDIEVSLHLVTIEDAIEDGLLDRINQVTGAAMSREQFLQRCRNIAGSEENYRREFLCETIDESRAWLPMPLLRSCVYRAVAQDLLAQPGECPAAFVSRAKALREELGCDQIAAGMDIGRDHHPSVLWLLGWSGNAASARKHTLGVLVLRQTSYTRQARAIDSVCEALRPKRLCIDAGGLGGQLAEQARERHGSRVEGIKFTSAIKEDLAAVIRRAFEETLITIPDEAATLRSLNSVRCSYTSAGNPRYDADASDEGHADEFWALALALHAADATRSTARAVAVTGGCLL